jgi:hypothetical protein
MRDTCIFCFILEDFSEQVSAEPIETNTPCTSSLDSSVCVPTGIALSYELDVGRIWIQFPADAVCFSLQNAGPHPASYIIGTGGSSSEIKQHCHEADHSQSSGAEVKSGGTILLVPEMFSWCNA